YNDDRVVRIGRLGGHLDRVGLPAAALDDVQLLVIAGQQVRLLGLRRQLRDRQLPAVRRPFKYMQVERFSIPFTGDTPPLGRRIERAGAAAVDRFAVGFHPLADLAKDADRFRRELALGRRADVEQVVASLARDIDQILDYDFGFLPVVVVLV